MNEIYSTISGRVQMVMFRDFVQRKARSLGLNGSVRNLEDGRVEVVAQGSDEKIKTLIKHLHKGPFLAQVEDVSVTWRTPKTVFDDFKIIF